MILDVEDPAIVAALEAHIDTLLAQSPRVDCDDPDRRSSPAALSGCAAGQA